MNSVLRRFQQYFRHIMVTDFLDFTSNRAVKCLTQRHSHIKIKVTQARLVPRPSRSRVLHFITGSRRALLVHEFCILQGKMLVICNILFCNNFLLQLKDCSIINSAFKTISQTLTTQSCMLTRKTVFENIVGNGEKYS